MENIDVSENHQETQPEVQVSQPENLQAKILKHKKTLTISVIVFAACLGLFFTKGLFIAATVGGSPISRLAVIKELEKQSGKQVLESLINKKLIENELNKNGVIVTKEEIDAEIARIDAIVVGQGSTLEEALSKQNMTEDELREQIVVQKKMEKFLEEKTQVSSQEIDAYIKANKITTPKGVKVEDLKAQLSSQLKQQKFQQEAQAWVANLTENAKINYYTNY